MTIRTSCPKCGRDIDLPLPEGIEVADAQRLARLVLCDACAARVFGRHDPEPDELERAEIRLPYADE